MKTMGLRVYAGRTFFLPTSNDPENIHLWVALTDPDDNPEKVVVVNLTTLRPGCDTTLVLEVGDHRFIKHDTVVRYIDAQFASVEKIKSSFRSGISTFHDDCDDNILELIQEGLLKSPFTPKYIKNYCKERFEF